MILRPYAVVVSGQLEFGLELVIQDGVITEMRPHTGIPDNYVVSPAFVNAHSHLEYRGMLGKLKETSYWPWIRELTALKKDQTDEEVRADCLQAALENRASGVRFIGEHSDRPFAAEALAAEGLDGIIFQELITFLEREAPEEKYESVARRAALGASAFPSPVVVNPHATYTVDETSLRRLAGEGGPISIHVAETEFENEWCVAGSGLIANFYRQFGFEVAARGMSVVSWLNDIGLVREGVQFVHACDVSPGDIELMASAGVTVAHCPRSNMYLKCPCPPVRELLDAGVVVGLGLDSPASSGPIDMFAEMRAALELSCHRGKPLAAEEVWRMATSDGRRSVPPSAPEAWDVYEGSRTPLIKIHGVFGSLEELVEQATPAAVEHA